jgi:hypothetical protein
MQIHEEVVPTKEVCDQVEKKLISFLQNIAGAQSRFSNPDYHHEAKGQFYNLIVAEMLLVLERIPAEKRKTFIHELLFPSLTLQGTFHDGFGKVKRS